MSVATTADLHALVEGTEVDPHRILGPHGGFVRAWRPNASAVTVVLWAQMAQRPSAMMIDVPLCCAASR